MAQKVNPDLASAVAAFVQTSLPIRITAFDGSAEGPAFAEYGVHLQSIRGLAYLLSAPGELGLARAYISGELQLRGVHPGDPYELLHHLVENLKFQRPSTQQLARLARSVDWAALRKPPKLATEGPSRWRRLARGALHSKARDERAVQVHYDESTRLYELLLGPSMTYTCAIYPNYSSSLEEAQENKHRIVFEKLQLTAGSYLLDIGCGWGGMALYAARRGVKVLGVTLAENQAAWARQMVQREGLEDLVEIRRCDYRDVSENGFDAISSIGMTEHIGVGQYPAYFGFFHDKLRDGGVALIHCVTRRDNRLKYKGGPFTDRFVFPDGELTGSGRLTAEMQNSGLEVLHTENLREHYALTLRDWARNLVENWDEATEATNEEITRIWGLFMAGGRVRFDRNYLQLHQFLLVKPSRNGRHDLPLGQWWDR